MLIFPFERLLFYWREFKEMGIKDGILWETGNPDSINGIPVQ